jgi:quinol monooxygenase YgiN
LSDSGLADSQGNAIAAGIAFAAFARMVRLSVRLHATTCHARAIEDALRTLMRGTRLEPGCLGCEVWTSAEEESELSEVHYEERWANESAIEGRVRSDAFTKVLEVLEAAADVPRVEFDFVSRHQGLEYVEDIRRDRDQN